MKIQKIMTKKVVTLKPTDTLYSAIQKFAKKGLRGAPVINSGGRVLGVVTDADLTKALDVMTPHIRITSSKMISLMFASLRSKKEEDQIREELKEAKKIKVKTFMSTPIVINQGASLSAAIKEIVSSNTHRLPVINSKNKLVGIIARTDIIKALSNNF